MLDSAGYFLGMTIFNTDDSRNFLQPRTLPTTWNMYLLASLFIALVGCLLAVWWSQNGWSRHPLAQALQHLASDAGEFL